MLQIFYNRSVFNTWLSWTSTIWFLNKQSIKNFFIKWWFFLERIIINFNWLLIISTHIVTFEVHFISSIHQVSSMMRSVSMSSTSSWLAHCSRSLSIAHIKLIWKWIALVINILITLSRHNSLNSMRIVTTKVHRFISLHTVSLGHKIIFNGWIWIWC